MQGENDYMDIRKLGKKAQIGILSAVLLLAFGLLWWWLATGKEEVVFTSNKLEVEIHDKVNLRNLIKYVRDDHKEKVVIDSSSLNTDKVGKYKVTYKYQDKVYPLMISVVNRQPPQFNIHDFTVPIGMQVSPLLGVDDIKSPTKTRTYFAKKYTFSKKGDVAVKITVEDESGNKTTKKCTVHVVAKNTEPPVLEGVRDLIVHKGDTKFNYLHGIFARANYDPKPIVTVDTSKIDINRADTYPITYIAKDHSGNECRKTCHVVVSDTKEIGTMVPTKEKVMYLTFDDGPSQYTQPILDILDRYQVKATFFVTGMHEQYVPLIKTMKKKGHTVGMHTYSHNYAQVYASIDAYYQDLSKIEGLCKRELGYVPKYIRFPGGSSNTVSRRYAPGIMSTVAKQLIDRGFQYYDWNVSSGDASGTLPAATIIANATASNAKNIMILCHDAVGKKTTVDALPSIIEHYKQLGYRFEAINDYSFVPHHHINN